MAIIYDFKQARHDKFTPKPYIAPPMIKSVPENVQDTIEDHAALNRRSLFRVVVPLITSGDIPVGYHEMNDDPLPRFEYPSTEEK